MKIVNESTIASTLLSSLSPYSSDGNYVGSEVEKWLEDKVAGFRIWQLAGIILSILLSILIGFCCCIRFRVPRTKQEIEADYIRKKITDNFRHELSKISNIEMNDMDLKKALSKIQNKFDIETYEVQKLHEELTYKNMHKLHSKFNGIFNGIYFNKQEYPNTGNII
ncbi:transmembrane inner ear expressed protein [Apis laboriosa]|uniref:transmembrane inner ear expressed protein n=1 Tax=Apis laboriosa TaxID=183418 RepID=UPI001CC38EB9|nr:transmembrane inner ear expressed protein [Apis laboriosa]XP_043791377.1 transmembrane inner ear expressed protein [Apis laboriosa]